MCTRRLSLLLTLSFALWLALSLFLPTSVQAQTVTDLYSFSGSDGANPEAALIQATDGNLYGTTYQDGTSGDGAIFKITPLGTLTTLYSFSGNDGFDLTAGLIQASDGNLYGTAYLGGANNYGTVFKITPAGTLTTLQNLYFYTDGAYPYAGLIQGTDGNLYGTTAGGGAYGNGTIFKITLSGSLTTLYSFSATNSSGVNADGAESLASLIQGTDGNLYGTTYQGGANGYGTLFKITPGGTFSTLYTFSYSDGANPHAALLQASDGNLYGTTHWGGAIGYGTLFKITPAGTLTTLHSFSAENNLGYNVDGAEPLAGLIQAGDGNLYGLAWHGGANGYGTLFKITLGGTFTTLYSFTYSGGANPYAALLQASDGNLYGTTGYGGAHGYGGVFRVSGIVTNPILSSISPSSLDAGGPAFTLKVKGSNFQSSSTVGWNGNPLNTTYVSATALNAAVPASLIASAGTATVTVVTSGATSNKKSFTILLTTLKLTSANVTKNSDGSYTTNLSLKNVGYNTAPTVKITKATLGAAATSTTLPVTVGNIAAGATGNSSLAFPASAGTSGTVVTLKVSGTFSGGKFSGSLKVTLP